MISSKKGKLYFRLVLAVAIIAAAVFTYSALAAVPTSINAIVNTNRTTVNGAFIADASLEGGAL